MFIVHIPSPGLLGKNIKFESGEGTIEGVGKNITLKKGNGEKYPV